MSADVIYALYVREQPTIGEIILTEPLIWIILTVCILGVIAQFIPKE